MTAITIMKFALVLILTALAALVITSIYSTQDYVAGYPILLGTVIVAAVIGIVTAAYHDGTLLRVEV